MVEIPRLLKRGEKYTPPRKEESSVETDDSEVDEIPIEKSKDNNRKDKTLNKNVENMNKKNDTPVQNTDEVVGRPFDEVEPITRVTRAGPSKPPVKEIVRTNGPVDTIPKMPPWLKDVPDMRKPLIMTGLEDKIVDRILHGEITMQVVEVAAVAPAVKRLLKRAFTNLNLRPRQRKVEVNHNAIDAKDGDEHYFALEDLGLPLMEVLLQQKDGLPAGAIVHHDVVEKFLNDRPEDRGKKIIATARRSEDLRVTYPYINGANVMVESIMDNGSQIISMHTKAASDMQISWDPDVVIHMQSANGALSPTKGLARNVPFKWGTITVYLQVHIIDDCPYAVLIGRPFDCLCETSVKNYMDGDQQITLSDPNSNRRCTIATYPRGQRPVVIKPGDEVLSLKDNQVTKRPPSVTVEEVEEEETSAVPEKEGLKERRESVNFQVTLMNCLIDRER